MVKGVLSGIRIIELAGLGPAPFCGMLLSDLGAEVILIERQTEAHGDARSAEILNRGKRSIRIDLKKPEGVELVLELVETADGLIEGMRPGVMERLGLSPQVCLARNPRLAYGRMTGWGQYGPLSQAAGHDLNYLSVVGAAWYAGTIVNPVPPPSLIGDLGGGALYLTVGLIAAILHAGRGGSGQVIDAAVVDGTAHLQTILHMLAARGELSSERGKSWIDGAPWYRPYQCLDGRFVTVGALESKFFVVLLECLDLKKSFSAADQFDKSRWPYMHQEFEKVFASRTSREWCDLMEATDACFAPLLNPFEASQHPHNVARGIFRQVNGILQAVSAPRFSGFPLCEIGDVPSVGCDTKSILAELGVSTEKMDSLFQKEVI